MLTLNHNGIELTRLAVVYSMFPITGTHSKYKHNSRVVEDAVGKWIQLWPSMNGL